MSHPFRHITLGVFIASSLALLASGVFLLGVRGEFRKRATLIAYFDQSVNGLHEGAPVKWRGVTVGTVGDIRIRHNQARDDFAEPVILRVDVEDLRRKMGEPAPRISREFFDSWIQRGLRARLEFESLVSGRLFVELAMVPDDTSPRWHQLSGEYLEIPTVPTEMQMLLASFGRINFPEISRRLASTHRELDQDLTALDLETLRRRLEQTQETLRRARESADLGGMQADLRRTLDDLHQAAGTIATRLQPLAQQSADLLVQAQNHFTAAARRLEDSRGGGPTPDVGSVLADLAAANEALGQLMATFRRDPAVILTGREAATAAPAVESAAGAPARR